MADVYAVLLRPLHDTGVPYMVTGAVATIAYGEPRLTNDVDVVVQLDAGRVDAFRAAFPETAFYVPPREVIEEERRRPRFGHFNILHLETAVRADIYLAGSDPLHAWAFARRRSEQLEGGVVSFAPIEYVIVRKLEYFRDGGSDRHLTDIAGIVRVSGREIDMEALDHLLDERGLRESWVRARAGR